MANPYSKKEAITFQLINMKGETVMEDRLALVSYSLATIAGVCFVSGLIILSR